MVRPLHVRIAGLGSYLPERVVTSTTLERQLGLAPGWIAKRTGVLERRYATHETSVSQAVAASRVALERAGLRPEDLDAIIGASSVPEQAIPSTAALVQRALGAPDGGSACWDVNATCLSFPVALHAAALAIASGQHRTVLVFSSEIGSPSLNPAEPESASLFGDAAAAAVLQASDGSSRLIAARFRTFSSGADFTQVRGGGTRHRAGGAPELHLFAMNGPAVFKHAARTLPPFMHDFLQGAGWACRDVDALVPHQASSHGVLTLSERLGFGREQVVYNLPHRGNCIAASIPLALCEAVESGRIVRGQKVLLAGTAAGLTLGAVALEF